MWLGNRFDSRKKSEIKSLNLNRIVFFYTTFKLHTYCLFDYILSLIVQTYISNRSAWLHKWEQRWRQLRQTNSRWWIFKESWLKSSSNTLRENSLMVSLTLTDGGSARWRCAQTLYDKGNINPDKFQRHWLLTSTHAGLHCLSRAKRISCCLHNKQAKQTKRKRKSRGK